MTKEGKINIWNFQTFSRSLSLTSMRNKSPYEMKENLLFLWVNMWDFRNKLSFPCPHIAISSTRSRSIMCILFLVMSQNRLFIIFNLYVVFYIFFSLLQSAVVIVIEWFFFIFIFSFSYDSSGLSTLAILWLIECRHRMNNKMWKILS